ncbi:efflux RND transporter periplasmic adaptor subunit [Candidatus Parcubacteria bacterium]|nr:MAG: efflux RND transporter periplasmic adaptor subunit [Candidatus Parcubacteria bacterium]
MLRLFALIRKPLIYIPLAIAVAGGGWYWYAQQPDTVEAIEVQRGTVVAEVRVTGSTKAAKSVNLAFVRTGRVASVLAEAGTEVRAGQALATLDQGELAASLREAEASVGEAQANLAEVRRGTRPEELRIQEVKVENARTALADAMANLADRLSDAYTKSDDAVRVKADQFFSNPRTNPQLAFVVADPTLEITVESERGAIEQRLVTWRATIDDPAARPENGVAEARATLLAIRTFLDRVAMVLNGAISTTGLSQTTIDGWKSDVSTGRTNVNTALANLVSAEEKLRTAESNLAVAENELALKEAGATLEAIASAEAKLRQAEARRDVLRAQLAETVMSAPFAGLVTKQDAKVGEIVQANTALVSLISQDRMEIEANVPEVDIGKVNRGNPVRITLDAFPGEAFRGSVVSIEPGETIIDGVVNYKVRILFETPDDRLKSGLTANLDIEAQKKEGVLILPAYAIIETDDGTFVRPWGTPDAADVAVTLGLRGTDGNVEILEGVTEGDRVVDVGRRPSQ